MRRVGNSATPCSAGPIPSRCTASSSTLAGVAFVWVLIGLAARLGRNRTERAVTAGLVLTLGTMQLFFGYIENYPLMTLGVLIYAYLALRRLRGEIGLVWPASVLAVTHAFHPSTIILAPSLLYLAFAARPTAARNGDLAGDVLRSRRWRIDLRSVLSVVVPYGLVFAGVVALMSAGDHGLDALMGVDFPGGGDRSWFVPLFEITTKWQHYTMFSLGHLVDIVNQQLLVAPMVWPSLALIGLLAWRRLPKEDPTGRFLLLMAASYLLLTLVWNADYGGQKDWDLFSPAAVPAALLLAWALPRALPEERALWAGASAVIAPQAFHVGRVDLAEHDHALNRNRYRKIRCVLFVVHFLMDPRFNCHLPDNTAKQAAGQLGPREASVSELRRDPVMGRWVIIAPERGLRPDQVPMIPSTRQPAPCVFCGGQEPLDPTEIFAIRTPGTARNTPGWKVRVLPNKFPVLRIEGQARARGHRHVRHDDRRRRA